MSDTLEQPVVDSEVEGLDQNGEFDGEEEALDTEQAEDSQEDELEEDWDGVKVRGKKELLEQIKAERLMQADYTRKTQAVAEEKKAIEHEKQLLQAQRNFEHQNLEILADIRAAERELQQLGQIDLSQLSDQDPVQAQKVMVRMQQLQAHRAQAGNALSQRYQQFSNWQQQEAAMQIENGHRVLQREIPGWGPEIAQKLSAYALSVGFTQQEVDTERRPAVIRALWRDYQIAEAKKNATKRTPQVQSAPATRVATSSKARAVTDPDKMSPEQWLKWRNSQVKR